MIHVVLGTKAQLVKMAPVMVELQRRGVAYRFVHTGQHRASMDEMMEEFGLPEPDVVLHRGSDVVSLPQMAWWMAKLLTQSVTRRRAIFGQQKRGEGLVLVHGDTFSTLLGALMGRLAGLRVGHVESGLRSFDLWHPFPEEITRLLTFRLSHVLYCPGEWAMENVAKFARERIDTGANTLSDTLALALAHATRSDHVPREAFAIASLHRYENIFKRARFEELLETVEAMARERRVLFILHPPTERKLEQYGLRGRLEANPRIELRPRYTYFDVIALMRRADYIVTDGGSIQEESSYLGLPCLLLRASTERREGVGQNVVLSNYQPEVIAEFLRAPERHRRPPIAQEQSPSQRIVDSLVPESRTAGGAEAPA